MGVENKYGVCLKERVGYGWGFLLSHLHFDCNLLIARYGACAVILISAPYGHVVLLFLQQLPGDCSHINFV